MTGLFWALCGTAAGVVEIGLLARAAASRPRALPLAARLVLVGAVLALAARAQSLALGVAGWAAGFVLAGLVVYRRLG